MFWLCLITSLGCIYLSLQSEGMDNYLLKKSLFNIIRNIFYVGSTDNFKTKYKLEIIYRLKYL